MIVSDEARRWLVLGVGITGEAVARHLRAHDLDVKAIDDRPSSDARAAAVSLGFELVEEPDDERVSELLEWCDVVVVSPGVPTSHPVTAGAQSAGKPVVSELELAGLRAPMPLAMVTGTNGKTTVVTMLTAMLANSGTRALAAGNVGLPLIDAVGADVDIVVVEASSFQLHFTHSLQPELALWLNAAPDHLDWHGSWESYVEAKSKIWINQTERDVAVYNADDPVVSKSAEGLRSRRVSFGMAEGDYRLEAGTGYLLGLDGEQIAHVDELARSRPHDIANALATVAAARTLGVRVETCREVLTSFAGLPHRVQRIGQAGGVEFYNDSKATTPSAALAAIRSFRSVVLIAGGRNKGMDLSVLGEGSDHVKSVVAIGEAAVDIAEAFNEHCPVQLAGTMNEAVEMAIRAADDGDVVLLSPACASYDAYRSYTERGDDFRRIATDYVEGLR